jgi:hypothetical protein
MDFHGRGRSDAGRIANPERKWGLVRFGDPERELTPASAARECRRRII